MKPQRMYGKENHSFNPTEEARLLLNNEVVVTSHMSRFTGRKGRVDAAQQPCRQGGARAFTEAHGEIEQGRLLQFIG